MDAIAFEILLFSLLRVNGRNTPFAKAVSTDVKGLVSLALYVAAIAAAFFSTFVSDAIFIIVAAMWFVPDRRFEPLINRLQKSGEFDVS